MSLPLTMRFSLTNEDLLTAYNAQLDHVCKPALRYLLVALGCLGIIGPAMAYSCHFKLTFNLLDLVFIVGGVIIVRAWAFAPVIKRHKIRKESGATKMIRIIIDENAVTEESGDTPRNVREWDQIERIVETAKGFIFYFQEGPLMWLPTRVFENLESRDEFMNIAARKDKL